jgi:hypothetical protein
VNADDQKQQTKASFKAKTILLFIHFNAKIDARNLKCCLSIIKASLTASIEEELERSLDKAWQKVELRSKHAESDTSKTLFGSSPANGQ